jgi:hypothetical protein
MVNFFFILGCHRSGTTMLQQALNRHSRVVIPPETKYFCSFLGHSPAYQATRLAVLNRDLGINLRLPSGGITGRKAEAQFFRKLAGAYVESARKKGITYFGEKTPPTPVICGEFAMSFRGPNSYGSIAMVAM